MRIFLLAITVILSLLSQVFLSIWIYKDAKERNINPLIWLILIWSGSGALAFLIYFLVVRKEENIKCEKCRYVQSEKLLYCGRCGSEMKIENHDENFNKATSKRYLIIGIVLLIIAIIAGGIFSFNAMFSDGMNMNFSLISSSSKYGSTWKDTFKYKQGEWRHSFTIKDKTILNASWDVEDGNIEAKFYEDDKLIKEINSTDVKNFEELINLSEYKGSKVVLKLKFEKAYGKIKFFLE